ncbi:MULTISPECIES: hypothetical protein [unclassified Bradyrhizobium]|uniref:hypothetical protein n=1 Tax=unclassified Bradyrhizobium TaxID=2631580 RepID=UPI002916238E|nr:MULTISPECIES: hypothetical protein [unclassified Bradyrhizobium]
MIDFRRSSGERALPVEDEAPFILGEYWIPSTALILRNRALPITKPPALVFFEEGFFGAMTKH